MTPILPCPRCGQEPTQTMTWTGVTVACRPCDVTCFRFWTSRDRARATLAKVRSEWNSNARRIATTTLPFAILFVGAEGQGKTTLARDTDARLRARGVRLQEMIHEVARDVLVRMNTDLATLRASDALTNEYQEQVFVRQFEEEKARGFKNYVTDRGPDNLAYLAEHGSALDHVLSKYHGQIGTYRGHVRASVVFHVTPALDVRPDGTRVVTTSNEVHRIDAMIKFLLASWSVRPYQLRSANHAERMIMISNVIRDRAGITI